MTSALTNRLQQASVKYREMVHAKASGKGINDDELADVLERLHLADADFNSDVAALQSIEASKAQLLSDEQLADLGSKSVAAWNKLEVAENQWRETRETLQREASQLTWEQTAAQQKHAGAKQRIKAAMESAPRLFDTPKMPAPTPEPSGPRTIVRPVPERLPVGTRIELTRTAQGKPAGARGRIEIVTGDIWDPQYSIRFADGSFATVGHLDLRERIEPVEAMGTSERQRPYVAVTMA